MTIKLHWYVYAILIVSHCNVANGDCGRDGIMVLTWQQVVKDGSGKKNTSSTLFITLLSTRYFDLHTFQDCFLCLWKIQSNMMTHSRVSDKCIKDNRLVFHPSSCFCDAWKVWFTADALDCVSSVLTRYLNCLDIRLKSGLPVGCYLDY